jgi:Transposase DDE domain
MNNNVFRGNSHLESAVRKLKSSDGIPFKPLLSKQEIEKSLEKIAYRNRYDFYPPDVTLWLFLSQVLNNETMDATVARLMATYAAQGKATPSSNTAAYSQARSKLPEGMISDLAHDIAKQMDNEIPSHWLFGNKPIKLMDGSTVSMPDTAENQNEYPQPDTQKKGVGFPISRIVTVVSFSSGMILDLAMGPYSGKGTGEHALLRQLLGNFEPGDIAIGDAYYPSFFLIAYFMEKSVDFVFPINASRDYDFRRGRRLGKRDHIVEWEKPRKPAWMDEETYNRFPEKISMRELEIEKKMKGYRTEQMIIVTSFLNKKIINRDTLAQLYACRWFVELALRSIKQTIHMDILKGKTPSMVRKEIWTCILAYNLIRKIMCQSAILHDKNPRDLSFTHAMNLIVSFREKLILSENNGIIYDILLQKIAQIKVGNRPNRCEPRVVKRRPKAFPRMQKPRYKYNSKMAA